MALGKGWWEELEAAGLLLAEAVVAVDGANTLGLEGHRRLSATFGADYRVHLPRIASLTPLIPTRRAATEAALGLICKAPSGEELLLAYSEGKRVTAIHASKGPIRKFHQSNSSSETRPSGYPQRPGQLYRTSNATQQGVDLEQLSPNGLEEAIGVLCARPAKTGSLRREM